MWALRLQKARKLEASGHIFLVHEKLGKDCSNQRQTSCIHSIYWFFSIFYPTGFSVFQYILSNQISVQKLGCDCIFLTKSSIFGAINIICKQKSSTGAYFYTWFLLLLRTRRKISRIFCKPCLGKLSQWIKDYTYSIWIMQCCTCNNKSNPKIVLLKLYLLFKIEVFQTEEFRRNSWSKLSSLLTLKHGISPWNRQYYTTKRP